MAGKFIGRAAKELGVNPRTLRYYETLRLLPPPARTERGYRVYDGTVGERYRFIRKAKRAGLTLREIRRILTLRETGRLPCDSVRQVLSEHIRRADDRIRQLRALRSQLQAMLDVCRRVVARQAREAPGKTICPVLETAGSEFPDAAGDGGGR